MTMDFQGKSAVESPSGKGRVFKAGHFFAEVFYNLQVFHNVLIGTTIVEHLVIGKIRPIDKPDILWGSDLLTLHLQDLRKLDFLCINFDPECEISSDSGFHH
jgi:hypothetical protein